MTATSANSFAGHQAPESNHKEDGREGVNEGNRIPSEGPEACTPRSPVPAWGSGVEASGDGEKSGDEVEDRMRKARIEAQVEAFALLAEEEQHGKDDDDWKDEDNWGDEDKDDYD